MVIIHVANIDSSIIGGVQVAVPQMIRSQSQYATVGFINTHGDAIDGIQMLGLSGEFNVDRFSSPFDRPDLVVFHELYRFEYIGMYKAVLKAGIPYVIIPHGCLSRHAQSRKRLKKLVANLLYFNAFLKSARSIQYLSENEAKLSAFSRYPAFICGNGVSLPEKRKKEFFNEGISIVYIGRLEIGTKGLDLLLEAVEKCSSIMRSVGAKVKIYGPDYNGEHAILCKMVEKLGVSDLVILGREKMGKEKEEILLSADCFIQASRTEGMPMGPLEALGYGIPCIVTEGVGLGELIESYGAGFRCETTAEGIADAIEMFIENREKAEAFSESAVGLMKKHFDRDLIAQTTVDMYCRLVKDK